VEGPLCFALVLRVGRRGRSADFAVVAVIYFRQHSMIYHPRPYDASYTHALPSNGVEVNYTLPAGKQTTYYIPGRE
jgi:hypothetical protein